MVEHKVVSVAAVIRILLKLKYQQDKNCALLAAMLRVKAKLFCLKKLCPG